MKRRINEKERSLLDVQVGSHLSRLWLSKADASEHLHSILQHFASSPVLKWRDPELEKITLENQHSKHADTKNGPSARSPRNQTPTVLKGNVSMTLFLYLSGISEKLRSIHQKHSSMLQTH